MPTKTPSFDEAIIHFRDWRAQKKHVREKIPEALWQEAIALSADYPVRQLSQKLGFDPKALRKRMEAEKGLRSLVSQNIDFVEAQFTLPSFSSGLICEQVEFERADGSRMRLQTSKEGFDVTSLMSTFLKGSDAPDHSPN